MMNAKNIIGNHNLGGKCANLEWIYLDGLLGELPCLVLYADDKLVAIMHIKDIKNIIPKDDV